MKKLISIIIVNYNWKKWLYKCINSLLNQNYKDFEIIFVDNASQDASIEYMKNTFQDERIKIVENKENSWFAGWNNLGYKYSTWDYILLLNNDTWVEMNYLENFIKAFDEISNLWSVQSKLILMNDISKLDVCWSYWTSTGFLYHYWYWKSSIELSYNKSIPFFSNKWTSMMIKKDIIEKIWLFDNDFWCYYEETDLCHRIWIAWYECWYYPKAVCYHAMWWTSTTFKNSYIQFHNFKNKLLSFLKNFEFKTLILFLPIYFIFNILISFFWLLKWKIWHFFCIYKAIYRNIKNIKNTLSKRKIIQKMRKISDKKIFQKTKKNPKLSYFYYMIFWLEKYND